LEKKYQQWNLDEMARVQCILLLRVTVKKMKPLFQHEESRFQRQKIQIAL